MTTGRTEVQKRIRKQHDNPMSINFENLDDMSKFQKLIHIP